jgi:hypothetical protein
LRLFAHRFTHGRRRRRRHLFSTLCEQRAFCGSCRSLPISALWRG